MPNAPKSTQATTASQCLTHLHTHLQCQDRVWLLKLLLEDKPALCSCMMLCAIVQVTAQIICLPTSLHSGHTPCDIHGIQFLLHAVHLAGVSS